MNNTYTKTIPHKNKLLEIGMFKQQINNNIILTGVISETVHSIIYLKRKNLSYKKAEET